MTSQHCRTLAAGSCQPRHRRRNLDGNVHMQQRGMRNRREPSHLHHGVCANWHWVCTTSVGRHSWHDDTGENRASSFIRRTSSTVRVPRHAGVWKYCEQPQNMPPFLALRITIALLHWGHSTIDFGSQSAALRHFRLGSVVVCCAVGWSGVGLSVLSATSGLPFDDS